MPKLEQQLTALETMPLAELRQKWERVHIKPAPKLSADLLRLGIAYRLQEKKHGGLSRATLKVVKAEQGSGLAYPAIKSGTRLVRGWNGRTISVLVDRNSFLFEERRYNSLSAIAREITGTSWSGPRFFGLNGTASHG